VFISPGGRVATHFSRLLRHAWVTVGLFLFPGHRTGNFYILGGCVSYRMRGKIMDFVGGVVNKILRMLEWVWRMYSPHGRNKKCIQNLAWEIWMEETAWHNCAFLVLIQTRKLPLLLTVIMLSPIKGWKGKNRNRWRSTARGSAHRKTST
jgi:hypothetical protein